MGYPCRASLRWQVRARASTRTKSKAPKGVSDLHGHPSGPMSPISRLTAGVAHCKNYNFRRKILIDNAERELAEDILSEVSEVEGPTLGSFSDFCYCLSKGVFKVNRCNQATLSLPPQQCQIFLFRFRMNPNQL